MADVTILNNYSDDANIKQYIQYVLAPKVFKDIPINVLNTGSLGMMNETMSQAMQNVAFTSAFYLNENFITKAVLPDSDVRLRPAMLYLYHHGYAQRYR